MVTIEGCTFAPLSPEAERRLAVAQAGWLEESARHSEEAAASARRHADWARQQAAQLG